MVANTDVVVMVPGAGLAAAMTARKGARVMVFEKRRSLGNL
jgi:ribulose 1,5-bisphosphate synthetase/thiazole synthase